MDSFSSRRGWAVGRHLGDTGQNDRIRKSRSRSDAARFFAIDGVIVAAVVTCSRARNSTTSVALEDPAVVNASHLEVRDAIARSPPIDSSFRTLTSCRPGQLRAQGQPAGRATTATFCGASTRTARHHSPPPSLVDDRVRSIDVQRIGMSWNGRAGRAGGADAPGEIRENCWWNQRSIARRQSPRFRPGHPGGDDVVDGQRSGRTECRSTCVSAPCGMPPVAKRTARTRGSGSAAAHCIARFRLSRKLQENGDLAITSLWTLVPAVTAGDGGNLLAAPPASTDLPRGSRSVCSAPACCPRCFSSRPLASTHAWHRRRRRCRLRLEGRPIRRMHAVFRGRP